jgi:hypothetical protein
MKKEWLFVALMALPLILAACDKDSDLPTGDSVFEGGTQGLTARFEPFGVEENGIFTIFDTEKFPIEIVLENRGEEDILPGEAEITLKGINTNDFTGISGKKLPNSELIEGISEFNTEGDEEIVDFTPGEGAKYKFDVTGFFQPDIFATFDYNYKTHLIIPKVCFKEDLQDNSVCDVQGSKKFFVSAAPITVEKVEQDVAGRGIVVLIITTKNVGGGKVTLPNAQFDSRFDQLSFTIETNPQDWDCRSAGRTNEARLINGKAVVTCKLNQQLEEDELFTKQIELTFNYRYRSVIEESVRIKESLE